jgi:demethoxyubiquinone hydroxylase (CLK1/Coq7/Cat5 family)
MLQPTLENAGRSWLDGALARFAADNAELAAPTRALLERLVPRPARHALLINTLSMLEHLGSHKIMSTQHGAAIDQATLRHVAEEAHHAYFMKRQAEKAAARPLEYVPADLLAPAAARMYFQRLEARMVRSLAGEERSHAAYLYMSMIVEFRALWFYGLYDQVLKRASNALSLKRLLGEEQNHLAEMAERLEDGTEHDALADEFLRVEKGLYARLLGAMTAAA